MCDDHSHVRFMPFHRFMPGSICCPPFEVSKETKIKGLEALKSRIEDYLKQIDEQIEELQKKE